MPDVKLSRHYLAINDSSFAAFPILLIEISNYCSWLFLNFALRRSKYSN
jgi:hypothetical protein